MGEWSRYTFRELQEQGALLYGDGYRAKNSELSIAGEGPIFLRAGHVGDQVVDFLGTERFKETNLACFQTKLSQTLDVMVTTKGNSTGRVAAVRHGMPRFVYSPHISFWRSVDQTRLVPGFLFAWARSHDFNVQLKALAYSTDMAPYLSLTDQARLSIPLPPLKEQQAIAAILGALDDKIENNRRTNETLEAMARAIFQSWFVDFDPVHAKAAGQLPAGMDDATAALFPSEFQDSALGLIPKGWRATTFGDAFHITMGQSPPGSSYNEDAEGLPFFQGRRDFGDRFPSKRVYCTQPTRFAKEGDILLTVRAPVGDVNIAPYNCCIGRGLAAIRDPSGSQSWVLNILRSKTDIWQHHDGSGTVFGSINKNDLAAIPVVYPCPSLFRSFIEIAGKLDAALVSNALASTDLATTRDTLLPKLLSGELRVPEAEALVEAAV